MAAVGVAVVAVAVVAVAEAGGATVSVTVVFSGAFSDFSAVLAQPESASAVIPMPVMKAAILISVPLLSSDADRQV
ncbi:MAG TPA: hypothetical protein DEP24_04510 [Mycobacterium sp.]|nr:hypothetical protein [Mycobacterium sp.]